MKKIPQLSVLCILLLFNKINAQITITSANMPASGDTIRYSNCRTTSINYSVTGANVVWNYDTLFSLSQGIYDYTPASATPYSFYFTGGDYGLEIADSIGVATYEFHKVYDFYKNTTAAFETKGLGFTYSGLPLAATYNPVDEIYVFPLTYLNHDSTPYKVAVALTSTVSYTQFGYRITDVDGWGTISTPYDTATPCIRVVSTTYGKDSLHYSAYGIAIPDVQRSYKWLSLTEKIPLLELDGTYTGGNFIPTQARFRDGRSFAGIKQIAGTSYKISVFPNPTSGDLYIYTSNSDISTVNLYDLSGALVASYKTSDIVTKVSTQNLSKGSYIYRVATKDGTQAATGKVIVIN